MQGFAGLRLSQGRAEEAGEYMQSVLRILEETSDECMPSIDFRFVWIHSLSRKSTRCRLDGCLRMRFAFLFLSLLDLSLLILLCCVCMCVRVLSLSPSLPLQECSVLIVSGESLCACLGVPCAYIFCVLCD